MKKNNKGFTILELIVVIAIIGILAAVLIPSSISMIKKARQSAFTQEVNSVEKIIDMYLLEVSTTENVKKQYPNFKRYYKHTTGQELPSDIILSVSDIDRKLTFSKNKCDNIEYVCSSGLSSEYEIAKNNYFFSNEDGLTEQTAFLIYDKEELIKMRDDINYHGNQIIGSNNSVDITYSSAYYQLMNDISINDKTFIPVNELGLIKVSDETYTLFIGTGKNPNYRKGKFYKLSSNNDYEESEYNGSIENWIPIGNETIFDGHFNGNNHTISGIYINSESNSQGFFGKISDKLSFIKNLTINNSLIIGGNSCGGLAGKYTPPANAAPPPTTPVEPPPVPTTPVEPLPVPTTPIVTTPDPTTPVEPTPVPTTPVEPPPVPTTPDVPLPPPTTPIITTPDPTTPIEPPPVPITPLEPPPVPITPISSSSLSSTLNISNILKKNISIKIHISNQIYDIASIVSSENYSYIYNCSFNGIIICNSFAGGIVGNKELSSNVAHILNSKTSGYIYASSDAYSYVGGICGTLSSLPAIFLVNCISNTYLKSNGSCVGALVGYCPDSDYLINCQYKINTAIDGNETNQNGSGSKVKGQTQDDFDGIHPYIE